MDINFDGLVAQGKVLQLVDVNPNEDYFVIAKYDPKSKEFKLTHYPVYAIKASDVLGSGQQGVQTVTGPAVDNTDPLNPVINILPVENPILKKTFNLNATDISTNLPMMLELEASGECVILSVVYDYQVNGGVGMTYGGGQTGFRVDGTFGFAPTNLDLVNAYTTTGLIGVTYEYQLTILSLNTIDPLTTLTIEVYYFKR